MVRGKMFNKPKKKEVKVEKVVKKVIKEATLNQSKDTTGDETELNYENFTIKE